MGQTQQQAQERLERNRQAARRRNADPEATLLRAGIVVCGSCGRPLFAIRQPVADGSVWNYACKFKNCPSNGLSTRAAPLDAEVWEVTRHTVTSPGFLSHLATKWFQQMETRRQHNDQDVSSLERHLKELERQQTHLVDQIANAVSTEVAALLQQRLDGKITERKRIQALLQQAHANRQATDERQRQLAELDRRLNEKTQLWESPDVSYHEKRMLLETLDVKVVVWPVTHTPRWLMFTGWTAYLMELLTAPEVFLPVPHAPLLPEAMEEVKQVLHERFYGPITAAEGTRAYHQQVAASATAMLNAPGPSVTIDQFVPDVTTFGRDMVPAIGWGLEWLERPKPNRFAPYAKGAISDTHKQ